MDGGRLRLLQEALEQLAAAPEDQLRLLRGAVVADELVLSFDDAWKAAPESLRASALGAPCRVIAANFENMQRMEASIWSDDALRNTKEWSEQRTLAKLALKNLAEWALH